MPHSKAWAWTKFMRKQAFSEADLSALDMLPDHAARKLCRLMWTLTPIKKLPAFLAVAAK